MWVWAHLVVGYIAYLFARPSAIRHGDRHAVLAALLASVLPDLIDKPLAWGVQLLPSGRSAAHSVFALVLVSGAVWVLARKHGRREAGIAFPIGYGSHLASDAVVPLYHGAYDELGYLLWPLSSAPEYDEPTSVLGALRELPELSTLFLAELVFALALGCLCLYHLLTRTDFTGQ
ncbi:MAG: hypothetical protein ACI8TL_000832 [Natronomonas sp.]|jgi:hypothetical protein